MPCHPHQLHVALCTCPSSPPRTPSSAQYPASPRTSLALALPIPCRVCLHPQTGPQDQFDEILPQQHHPKRAPDSADRLPTCFDNLSCLRTNQSLVCPNTATDSQEGQYLMGLNPSGYERSAAQPDYLDLFNSTLSPITSNKGKFNTHFQSPCPSSHSNSSDDLAFQGRGGERATLQLFFAAGGALIRSSRCPRIQVRPARAQPKHLKRGLQSRRPLAAHQHRQHQPQDRERNCSSRAATAATGNDEGPSKISFSGDRSNHPSLISKTRKRSKQLTYAAANQDGAGAHGPVGPGPSAIQYLDC
ncbi:hypothetical protein PtB15_3B628 [Puccinia triticina]|nr:hypothetical protein PtB15_3B628 [Puccinia triticina]